MGDMLLQAVENVNSVLDPPKGDGGNFLTPPGPNQHHTSSGDSSLTHPVSTQMQFGDHNIRP